MANAVIDRDLGLSKILNAMVGSSTVRVGVQGSDVAVAAEGENLSLAQIATVHEFGSSDGRVPERSFLRSTFAEQQANLSRLLTSLLKKVTEGKSTVNQALELVGLKLVDKVKAKIRSNIPPPLKQATIDKKKSSIALIDRGRLIGSIRAVVKRGSRYG